MQLLSFMNITRAILAGRLFYILSYELKENEMIPRAKAAYICM